ncbi:GNAT family N-acetyltransferase [Phenylobacterium sp.]|jgi:RimJ/RimL family protein N-acetyltransferase|uniref:GNAT family N-acetyltransferase n=1 Tax=Phenylobacterium sp. TaxID=1871053 RepID=UPI0037C87D5A
MRVILETARLRLREATMADASFILAQLNSPGFKAYIGDRGVRDDAGALGYIKDRLVASYLANGYGLWVAECKTDGLAVGIAGLVRREGLDCPDVGYAFLEAAWGQGYATEAAAGVLAHAREELGIDRLAAITAPDNHASMAVLRKIGFNYQGLIRLPGSDLQSTHFTWP